VLRRTHNLNLWSVQIPEDSGSATPNDENVSVSRHLVLYPCHLGSYYRFWLSQCSNQNSNTNDAASDITVFVWYTFQTLGIPRVRAPTPS
jgi:hypothetical protein